MARHATSRVNDPIARLLAWRPLVILDGGLATELQGRGANLEDPLWSAKCLIEQPELIRAVHSDYFEAGADVVTSATYQATFEGFERRGIPRNRGADLMLDAVALAQAARDEFWAVSANRVDRLRPLVAASIGPYGAMLADGSEYRGDYSLTDTELMDFHAPRLRVLAESGADLLACETIPCLREALTLARLLREYPSMTAWISFSCRDGLHNCEGQEMAECVAALEEFEQIAAIGVNCTRPDYVSELLREMRNETTKPMLAYPNSGEAYDPQAKQWRGTAQARPFAAQARIWYSEGARLLGGCCRTTPADIKAIAQWTD